MNLGDLMTLSRAYIPGAKSNAISDVTLKLILNQGALDIAKRLECLKRFDYFASVANQKSYRMSSLFTKYLGICKEGVWMLSDSKYQEMDPETIQSLNHKFKSWREDSGAIALRYAMWGGDLFIPHPYVDEAVVDAFLIYFFERPETMSDAAHFPFHITGNQTVERSDLAILSDSLIEYAEWKVLKVLDKRDDAYQKFNEYLQNLELIRVKLENRPDITAHDGTKFSGPQVGK